MRNKFVLIAALTALVTAGCSTSDKGLSGATTAKSKRSGFQLPAYKTMKLENGLEILLIEDHKLPSYSLILMSKTGSRIDPKGKSGLGLLMTSLLEKGTKRKSAPQVADAFGQLGSDFSADVDLDNYTFSTSSISKDRDTVTDLFAEVLFEPAFTSTELVRLKKQVIAGIKQGYDDPDDFTDQAFNSHLMPEHPYGRPIEGTIRDLQNISIQDVRNFYAKNLTPETSMLAVVGDFDQKTLDTIKEKFGKWPVQTNGVAPLAKPVVSDLKEVTLIERPDLSQAQIRFGHLGISRSNPDFLRLRVANTILGGGFSSRLMKKIRVEKGLTYGISSGFSTRLVEGPFSISTFTRFEKVGETVSETIALMDLFREKGVTQKELNSAKGFLKGAFPRSFETPEAIASNLLILRLYSVPDSYLTNYLRDLEAINLSDLNETIKKYFHPEKFKVVVYAPKEVLPQLNSLGDTTVKVKSYKEYLQ